MTPPHITRSARNRTRRRAATEPRHAAAADPSLVPGPARRRTVARRDAEQRVLVVRPTPAQPAVPAGAAEPLLLDEVRTEKTRRGCRRAPARRGYLGATLLRCGLYLGPLSVAVAAADPLRRVAWPVPVVTLVLGWAAAQALTGVGLTIARRTGADAAARMAGGGFAAVAALWCALVWIAPDRLLGDDRALAAAVGLGGLATLATVTAALITRSEAAIVRWSVPCWLLGAAALIWPTLSVATLLPAAIVAAAIRAFRPALLPGHRPAPRLTDADLRRGGGHLVIGASQAVCAALLWRSGPAGAVALPLLLSVPLLEALTAWHTERLDAGLDSAGSGAEVNRHVRNVTAITVAGLLPPLAAGAALALAAYRLPAAGARAVVLALAAGMLLAGVVAITSLLCVRARTGIAAALAAAPPLATASLPVLPLPAADPLSACVAVLVATHLAGLFIVALTPADL